MTTNFNNCKHVCAAVDATIASGANPAMPASDRDLITRQTGTLLITLGKMFTTLPAFRNTIDNNTGEMLITIGRKLNKKKS